MIAYEKSTSLVRLNRGGDVHPRGWEIMDNLATLSLSIAPNQAHAHQNFPSHYDTATI